MHGNAGSSSVLSRRITEGIGDAGAVEVVLCPPFTSLDAVGKVLHYNDVVLGAQDVHFEPEGAWTGEVSASMLKDAGCAYVIVGHSERRAHFDETGEIVRRKARAVIDAGMHPILCLGETWEQREAGRTDEVLATQVREMLQGNEDGFPDAVIAYEPVWAIGTGKTATAEQAQVAHAFLRERVADLVGSEAAAAVRIQYGGSVKPSNAREIFERPDVDGGLIGGASLDAGSFLSIVEAARPPA
jgi:triosephosphate isomerase